MTRRYIKPDPRVTDTISQMLEKDIVKKLSDNKTREKSFLDNIKLVDLDGEETIGYAFYTYRGHLCVLNSAGMDCDFLNFNEETQERIYDAIMANRYK